MPCGTPASAMFAMPGRLAELTSAVGAQTIAYFAGESSAFAFAAAQADSISSCLLQATASADSSVQVSVCHPHH